MHYFTGKSRPKPGDEVRCTDRGCGCGGSLLSPSRSYLYVSAEAAAFRVDAPSYEAAKRKIDKLKASGNVAVLGHRSQWTGLMICEMSAKRRGLNLTVANADATHWWSTGQMPLRATPMAGQRESNVLIPKRGKPPKKWFEFWRDDPAARTEFVYVLAEGSAPVSDKIDYSKGAHDDWNPGMPLLAKAAFPNMKWPKDCKFGGAFDSQPDPVFSEAYQDEVRTLAWNAYHGVLLRENLERLRRKKSAVAMKKRADYEIDVARSFDGTNTDVAVIRRK
ncbi:hypothetical protein BH10PLA1_BH10PLA1_20800 [soil metagenome]